MEGMMCDHIHIGLKPGSKPGLAICPICQEEIVCPHPFHYQYATQEGMKCHACEKVQMNKIFVPIQNIWARSVSISKH